MSISERVCKGCRNTKPVDDFYKTGKLSAGGVPKYHGKCKQCFYELRKQYLAENPDVHEKRKQARKRWRERNPKKVELYRQRENANPVALAKRRKFNLDWCKRNREKRNAYERARYQEKKEAPAYRQ